MNVKAVIAFVLCLAMPLWVLYQYAYVRGVQRTIERETLLHDAMRDMDVQKPLPLPLCYKTTKIVSLQNKGMDMRRRYNIRYNLCKALRNHLEELDRWGYVSQSSLDKISKRIRRIESDNDALKEQFVRITTHLEEQHAKNVEHQYAERVDETLKTLERQNEEIIRRAPIPMEQARSVRTDSGENTRQVDATRKDKPMASQKRAMEDRSGLEPMIANMQALRCREAESRLYQERLLKLLPMIRNGADVNVTLPETKGNTALHYACGIGSWSITRWLVEHGADVNAVTAAGKTPLDCVGSDNAKRIRELLVSRGGKRSVALSGEAAAAHTPIRSGDKNANYMNELGLDYQYGRKGKPQNHSEAARCFRLAAEQGHAEAQNNLGNCYHNGWGVPKDYTQSAMWYKRSAEQGNAWGISNYGTCLEFGWGVEENVQAAIKMYREAAARGNVWARKHLMRLEIMQ